MAKQIGLIATGLLASVWCFGLAQAQTQGHVGVGVMTPDTNGTTRNYTKMQAQVDNRRLTEAMGATELHQNASKIAECIARRGGDKAGEYLGGGLTGDDDYARLGKALNGKFRNCANGETIATAAAISGALAEQLLMLKAPTFEDRAIGVDDLAAREFFGDLAGQVTFDNIAGCLAVYSPGLTYKLLQTDVGSDAETTALRAVFAQSPECNMSTPPTSMIPAPTQRAALATALYEWTVRQS